MSSKRAQRRKVHDGKLRFDTIEDAIRAAKRASWVYGSLLRGYSCSWCAGFHIGHEPAESRKARKVALEMRAT